MTETAVIVVDLVRDFTHREGAIFYETTERIMPIVCNFIEKSRGFGAQIIYIQNVVEQADIKNSRISKKISCVKGSGGELLDERLTVLPQDKVIKKNRFSAFFKTNLEDTLKELNVKKVVIVGTKTNCCVRATAIDAQMRDYDTFIASDCVSTNTDELNKIHLDDLAKYTAKVMSSREILELMENDKW